MPPGRAGLKQVVESKGHSSFHASALGQRKGHIGVATPGAHFSAATGDHEKLPAMSKVGRRRRVTASGKYRLPQDLAGLLIKCPEHFVLRRGDVTQPGRCDHGPSVILGPSWWNS